MNRGMTSDAPVLYDVSNSVATITLNRPKALNSLTTEARVELLDALRRAASDESARVVDQFLSMKSMSAAGGPVS